MKEEMVRLRSQNLSLQEKIVEIGNKFRYQSNFQETQNSRYSTKSDANAMNRRNKQLRDEIERVHVRQEPKKRWKI
jgi:hypothetical protein